jgi:hypothetical protein
MSEPAPLSPTLRRLQAIGFALLWLVAAGWVFLEGLTPMAYAYLLFALAPLALRKLRLSGRWRSGPRGFLLGMAIGAVPLVAVVVSSLPGANRLPIFAGADLTVAGSAVSETVGSSVAPRGTRFLVVDLELRPRLGARLGHVSYRDFRLRTTSGELRSESVRSRDLPDGCDHRVPRFEEIRCSVVFLIDQWLSAPRSSPSRRPLTRPA